MAIPLVDTFFMVLFKSSNQFKDWCLLIDVQITLCNFSQCFNVQ